MHEWNGHLVIFSHPQVIEISRQLLPLRRDILQKTVIVCPWMSLVPGIIWSLSTELVVLDYIQWVKRNIYNEVSICPHIIFHEALQLELSCSLTSFV